MSAAATAPQTIVIKGERYVVIPEKEYRRLTGKGEPTRPAEDVFRDVMAANLRAARAAAGLSQAELAGKLGVSKSMVAGTESGRIRVADGYTATVLRACKLPKNWVAPEE